VFRRDERVAYDDRHPLERKDNDRALRPPRLVEASNLVASAGKGVGQSRVQLVIHDVREPGRDHPDGCIAELEIQH